MALGQAAQAALGAGRHPNAACRFSRTEGWHRQRHLRGSRGGTSSTSTRLSHLSQQSGATVKAQHKVELAAAGDRAAADNHASVSGAASSAAAPARSPIRRALQADLQHLCTLEQLTAEGATWTNQQIEAELSRQRATVLVVDEGAGPVGWAVGWAVPGELHVMNVAVHPDHRRRGHARALLATLVDLHRSGAEVALLEVRISNEPALSLYHSLGFERVGLRKKYYQNGEDAVLMTLQIEAGACGAVSAE